MWKKLCLYIGIRVSKRDDVMQGMRLVTSLVMGVEINETSYAKYLVKHLLS